MEALQASPHDPEPPMEFIADTMPAADTSGDDMNSDDSLTDLEKYEMFIRSSIPLQRLVYVKRLGESARDAGMDSTLQRICPTIDSLISDTEMVIRQSLAVQLVELSRFFIDQDDENGSGYGCILDIVMPVMRKLIQDAILEVRQEAADALVEVAGILCERDIDDQVFSLVSGLLEDERDDLRMMGVSLMNKLAAILGAERCKQFSLNNLVVLSQDASFRVRKTCAQNFSNIARVAGPEFTVEHLLPVYDRLSNDAIWSVRKGCVESLVPISEAVTRTERSTVILAMFKRFIKDISRWVRNESYEILGRFLYSLEEDLISPELLRFYTDIPTLSSKVVDGDVSYFCAFSFPAVVSRLGKERWDELSQLYFSLSTDTKFKVRRTLSHSLHLVARTLGTELTDRYLLPTLEMFLKDLDEVRVGVINTLSDILSVMSEDTRTKYLDTLWEIQRESDQNWRFRLLLAGQLPALSVLFAPDLLATAIVPLAMALSRDRISDVRLTAVKSLGHFINRLKQGNDAAFDEIVKEIVQFAESDSFQERQLFIRMSQTLLEVEKVGVFPEFIIDHLTQLATDRVVNVRISLARFLRDDLLRHSTYRHNEKVLTCFSLLRKDECRDVADFFSKCGQELDLLLQNLTIGQDEMADVYSQSHESSRSHPEESTLEHSKSSSIVVANFIEHHVESDVEASVTEETKAEEAAPAAPFPKAEDSAKPSVWTSSGTAETNAEANEAIPNAGEKSPDTAESTSHADISEAAIAAANTGIDTSKTAASGPGGVSDKKD